MVQLENGLYASFYRYTLSIFSTNLINNRLYSNINEYIKYNTQFYDFNLHFFRSLFICHFSTCLLATLLFLLKIAYFYVRNHHQTKVMVLDLKTNYLNHTKKMSPKNKIEKNKEKKVLFNRSVKNDHAYLSTTYYYY